MLSTLPSTRKDTELRSIWKLVALLWRSSAFEATFGAPRFVLLYRRPWKISAKLSTTTRERWLEYLIVFDYTLEYLQGSDNGKCRFPLPSTTVGK